MLGVLLFSFNTCAMLQLGVCGFLVVEIPVVAPSTGAVILKFACYIGTRNHCVLAQGQ